MRTSYNEDDVTFLLKDITGLVTPLPAGERERLIQSGKHYCEMLPLEYVPSESYMEAYQEALKAFARPMAKAVGVLSDKIMKARGESVVLVSLARAGTPVGILIRHYLLWKYHVNVPHYSISIIRGRGIDDCAMQHLLKKYDPGQLLFVDGWIGKGAIWNELKRALGAYEGVSDEIAVVADPANITKLCGTHEDILIPSSCLNSTVSGLVSRTFLRDDIIKEGDFHGAAYYGELKDSDLSYDFIQKIEQEFSKNEIPDIYRIQGKGMEEVQKLSRVFGIEDINFIKPGIGEATRVLLRRVPWKVLVDERHLHDPALEHLLRLAKEKEVPVDTYPLCHYKCVGIIRKVADV